jgi:hypothetical protein
MVDLGLRDSPEKEPWDVMDFREMLVIQDQMDFQVTQALQERGGSRDDRGRLVLRVTTVCQAARENEEILVYQVQPDFRDYRAPRVKQGGRDSLGCQDLRVDPGEVVYQDLEVPMDSLDLEGQTDYEEIQVKVQPLPVTQVLPEMRDYRDSVACPDLQAVQDSQVLWDHPVSRERKAGRAHQGPLDTLALQELTAGQDYLAGKVSPATRAPWVTLDRKEWPLRARVTPDSSSQDIARRRRCRCAHLAHRRCGTDTLCSSCRATKGPMVKTLVPREVA